MDIKGLYRLITYLIFTIIALVIVMVVVYNKETQRIETLSASAAPATVENTGPVFADEAEATAYAAGKELFRVNCAACHNRNMKDDLTGPALAGVEERWADYPPEDLHRWIRNSQAMINEGHPRATEMWAEWKPVVMTPFLSLSDEDIDAILLYIEKES